MQRAVACRPSAGLHSNCVSEANNAQCLHTDLTELGLVQAPLTSKHASDAGRTIQTSRGVSQLYVESAYVFTARDIHAASQFFTATDPRFQSLVDEWSAAGAVREWTGPVGRLSPASRGVLTPLPPSPPRYIASNGMRSLAQHMGESAVLKFGPERMQLRRPLWVSRMAADDAAGGWKLTGENANQGVFDAVVIAHNGERLCPEHARTRLQAYK